MPLMLSLDLSVGLLFPLIPSLPVSCSHHRPRKLYLWLKKENYRYKRWKAIENIAKTGKKGGNLSDCAWHLSQIIRKKCRAGRWYFFIAVFFFFFSNWKSFLILEIWTLLSRAHIFLSTFLSCTHLNITDGWSLPSCQSLIQAFSLLEGITFAW